MARPITGTPPLTKEETEKFIQSVEERKSKPAGKVATPKLKDAEQRIKERYAPSREK